MKQNDIENAQVSERQLPPEYEAPAIEVIVTREDLEREVHYAGFASAAG